MTDALYKKFVERWEEVTELPPTTLGPLTGLYKTLTRRLKVMPLPALFVVSLLCVASVYVLFGSAITLLVSLLQRGFQGAPYDYFLVMLLVACIAFGRNTIGIITRPYETYRRIVDRGSVWELIPIGTLLALYFAVASFVKTAAFRPFLLTRQFVLLAGSAAFTYLIVVILMWEVGKLVGGKGTFRSILLGWGYTLVPTTLWFLATSILYVLLPPPRTDSPAGIAFSVLFLIFSTALFFWKFMLTYLTMRFGLHLDLLRIVILIGICLPLLSLYSMLMYRWGIFRVPFL